MFLENPDQCAALHPDLQLCALPQSHDAGSHRKEARKFNVRWAECEDDVRAAQRLRHRIFAQEMGARLTPPVGTAADLDVDHFDSFCDHLLVHAAHQEDGESGSLVGTYRVLTPSAAQRAGGFYTDTEFDLTPLAQLRTQAVELGRSCVASDWRSGGVIMALWTALGQYMLAHRLDTMIGCASVGLNDGGKTASNLWHQLRHTHLIEPRWQVQPRIALPLGVNDSSLYGVVDTPPMIKGYLRCGARLLGPPSLDAAFNTADLPMILRMSDLAPRYRKHFLGT